MRQIKRTNTPGNDNNCAVNALATALYILFHSDIYVPYAFEQTSLKNKINNGVFDKLKQVYKNINGHNNDDIFGAQESVLDPKKQIKKLGRALRKYGANLMMEDVRGEQIHSNFLEQALLAAFEDYCGGNVDNFSDDTFAQMAFVRKKFKALHSGGPLSEEATARLKEELKKWWHTPYINTDKNDKQESLGGYQLYVMELEKDGVQLSPQLANIITESLGFNLVFDNQDDKQFRKLRYASDPMDTPSIIVHRHGAHWESYSDPQLVKNINSKLNNNVKPLSQMGAIIRDTTYLDFLTNDQKQEFEYKLINGTNEGAVHLKFGQAIAHAYGLKDTAIDLFAREYEKQVCDGQGIRTAVAYSLAKQNFNIIQYENDDKSLHVLNTNDFVEGFCKAACSEEVSRHDLLDFTKRYAFFKQYISERKNVKNGEQTAQQIATQHMMKWAQKQNQRWRDETQNYLCDFIAKDPLKNEIKTNGVKIISPLQVSNDEVVFELSFNSGVTIRRAMGATGQLEVFTTGGAAKQFKPEKSFDAIAKVFILQRCHKLGKAREFLTEEELSISLDFISPADKVEICRKAFLDAGFKNVEFIESASTHTQRVASSPSQMFFKNESTPHKSKQNAKTCRSEEKFPQEMVPRQEMVC